MNTLPRFLLPLALLLTACEPQAPDKLSPEAAAEFIALREAVEEVTGDFPGKLFMPLEDEMRQLYTEIEDFFSDYARSGDARLRSATVHYTMLHYAVKYRKEALVHELLQQGADPNATCNFSILNLRRPEMDAPLAWTVLPEVTPEELTEKPYRETAIRLIDTLAAAGARMDDIAGGHALFMCSITRREGAEDVYLHLLELGANPRFGYLCDEGKEEAYFSQAMDIVWRNPWPRAQEKLLEMGHLSTDWRNHEKKTLLFERVEKLIYLLRSGNDCYETAHNEQEWNAALQKEVNERFVTIELLLKHGADPNTPQGGGWTPLTYAAALSPQDMLPASMFTDKEAAFAAWRKLISLLLRHGGDANTTVPAHHDKPARPVRDYLPDMN